MHRIPLRLSTPSVSWNRNLPEYVLFEETLNSRNVGETVAFLNIMESEGNAFKSLSYEITSKQLMLVKDALNRNSIESHIEGLCLLKNIILHAPRDSLDLKAALKLRATWNFQRSYFDNATKDYIMFLYVSSNDDNYDLCEVHGALVISFYIMRQYDKTRKYLRHYNKYKAKLPGEYFVDSTLEKLDQHIKNFQNEMDDIENIVPRYIDRTQNSTPFKGFNSNRNIQYTSAACSYTDNKNNKSNKISGIYANSNIPKDSIILLEKPIDFSINVPSIQCELCLNQSEQVYNCLSCRYKTYCSLKCLEADKEWHRYECFGYQCLLLHTLDSKELFRLFVCISSFLNETIFGHKIFRKLTTAATVLEKAIKLIEQKDIVTRPYLEFLRVKPNYRKLPDSQYSTLVATAFRLAMFIEAKTNIFEEFYKKLRLPATHKSIVVGVILMRLHGHLLNNTLDFEYYYYDLNVNHISLRDEMYNWSKIIQPMSESDVENVNKCYNPAEAEVLDLSMRCMQPETDAEIEDALRCYSPLDYFRMCYPIERPMSIFKDKLAEWFIAPDKFQHFIYGVTAGVPTTEEEAFFLCGRIAEMDNLERCNLVRTFAQNYHLGFEEYFYRLSLRDKRSYQVVSLICTNLRKFRHSCAPNVEIVLLENGFVVGKTLREINANEELFVSYKAHYTKYNRGERKNFLKQLNIDCNCPCCEMPEVKEPTDKQQGIYCDNCTNIEITPAQEKCPNCNTGYRKTLAKYRLEKLMIDEEIMLSMTPNADDRKRYLLLLLAGLRVRKYFLPYNETRILMELKLIHYLALKNFSMESYKIMMEVKENVLKEYDENSIWFTFYSEMLTSVKIILFYNVDERLLSMPLNVLEELWKFGVHILNGQRNNVRVYKTFDADKSRILEDFRAFLRWREILQCSAPFSRVNKAFLENCSDIQIDEAMPKLIQLMP